MSGLRRIEAITIGDELLDGSLSDAHTARFGNLLRARGLSLDGARTVPDRLDAIAGALRSASEVSDLVLVTGGLGPTEDDITFEAAAQAAGVSLVEDADTVVRLKMLFKRFGRPLTPNNLRQAMIPEGGVILTNAVGTAPGLRLRLGRATCFFFPGVPREVTRLVDDHLSPWLDAQGTAAVVQTHCFRTFGRTESNVATSLQPLPRDPSLHVAYRAHFPEIRVTLHQRGDALAPVQAALAGHVAAARALLGDIVYSEDADQSLPGAIGAYLLARHETLAIAESCTGGMIGSMITDTPGASGWFMEGAITYSNAAKTARLGVPLEMLEAHGAVSEPVARAMAEGIRTRAATTWGISVTGIAGPGGGRPDRPIGTVHIAVAGPKGTHHRQLKLPFDRSRNRIASAWWALETLRRQLVEPSS